MFREIYEQFQRGEPISFMLFAILAVGWIIIFERFILLQFIYRINFGKFDMSMRKMLAGNDLDRARSYCQATSKTGLPLIVVKAIDAYQEDSFKVRPTVSEETLSFAPRIRRRISQLPNLATGAVLLGALAAVHGIWMSFRVSHPLQSESKNLAFADGLGSAMIPLAMALAVALLLMIPYGIIDAVAARLEGEIEHSLTVILNILAPETHATIAAQPMVAAAAIPMEASRSEESSGMIDVPPQTSKEPDDDVPIDKQTIPDEEEII
jgi:biopolymer transport protein ExbB/TolQ